MLAKLFATLVLSLAIDTPAFCQDVSIAKLCGDLIPAHPSFEDQKQKLWYDRFWTGNCAMGIGWCAAGNPNWISSIGEVTAAAPADKRENLRNAMCSMGYKVGMEWARENSVRRIDSADLKAFYATLHDASLSPDARVTAINHKADSLLGLDQ